MWAKVETRTQWVARPGKRQISKTEKKIFLLELSSSRFSMRLPFEAVKLDIPTFLTAKGLHIGIENAYPRTSWRSQLNA